MPSTRNSARGSGRSRSTPIRRACRGTARCIRSSRRRTPRRRACSAAGGTPISPFLEEPPAITTLRAVEVPPFGGDTSWANCALAFRHLSKTYQDMLRPLRVHMSAANNYATQTRLMGKAIQFADQEQFEQGQRGTYHPLVRTHPETGEESLYICDTYTAGFEGMTTFEAKPIVDFLVAHCTQARVLLPAAVGSGHGGDVGQPHRRCTSGRTTTTATGARCTGRPPRAPSRADAGGPGPAGLSPIVENPAPTGQHARRRARRGPRSRHRVASLAGVPVPPRKPSHIFGSRRGRMKSFAYNRHPLQSAPRTDSSWMPPQLRRVMRDNGGHPLGERIAEAVVWCAEEATALRRTEGAIFPQAPYRDAAWAIMLDVLFAETRGSPATVDSLARFVDAPAGKVRAMGRDPRAARPAAPAGSGGRRLGDPADLRGARGHAPAAARSGELERAGAVPQPQRVALVAAVAARDVRGLTAGHASSPAGERGITPGENARTGDGRRSRASRAALRAALRMAGDGTRDRLLGPVPVRGGGGPGLAGDPPVVGADPELHRLPEQVTPPLAVSSHPSPCTAGPAWQGGARVNAGPYARESESEAL